MLESLASVPLSSYLRLEEPREVGPSYLSPANHPPLILIRDWIEYLLHLALAGADGGDDWWCDWLN